MKRLFLLFSMLLIVSLAFAQDMQYVTSVSGDTLFVKDNFEFGGHSSLRNLMVSDSMAPATRVYYLKEAGFYPNNNNPASSTAYKTIIMGPEQSIKKGTKFPPIISGAYDTGVNSNGCLTSRKDLLVKNIDLEIGNTTGNTGGWTGLNLSGIGSKLQADNCIMEHTWWVWVGGPPASSVVKFTNCYMVNMTGHACRRNGGITDFNGSALNQDTLLVENCTHVNTQGMLYKFRAGYTVNRVIFNHNNFVNCSRDVIMSDGDQTNLSITNNMFINCNLQPYSPYLQVGDAGEVDRDGLPMGLVNVRVDSTFSANIGAHGVYVDKNLAYWDPSLSDIVSTVNTRAVNQRTDWESQMILMNTRTAALFVDPTYPKLSNGGWITGTLPTFANTADLFTTALATVKAFSMNTVDSTYGITMPSWRTATNPEATNFVYADFPIPIDLAYTNSTLLTAGIGGFPLGDLGWFPTTHYATWQAQRATEMAAIQFKVDNPRTDVANVQGLAREFELQQNYPNPFNPSTEISYTISKAGNVTLKVFNVLGQDVATLVNGYQAANTYKVNFNASGLSSGVYFYKLSTGSNETIKKMVLMK